MSFFKRYLGPRNMTCSRAGAGDCLGRFLASLALGLFLVVTSPQQGSAQSASFRSVDKNRDGVLSYRELIDQFGRAGADRLLRQSDRNNDDNLTISGGSDNAAIPKEIAAVTAAAGAAVVAVVAAAVVAAAVVPAAVVPAAVVPAAVVPAAAVPAAAVAAGAAVAAVPAAPAQVAMTAMMVTTAMMAMMAMMIKRHAAEKGRNRLKDAVSHESCCKRVLCSRGWSRGRRSFCVHSKSRFAFIAL